MRSKRLLAAVVAAITMLAGGLGMALWPSPAGATGSIRKFSGPLAVSRDPNQYGMLEVRVHNPHPTATLKPSVVVRDVNGTVLYDRERPVGPHRVVTANQWCSMVCTVEVNMTNAILQPSIHYFSVAEPSQGWQHVYSGDFSR